MASEAAKKEAAAEAARALAEGRGGSGQFTTPEPFALTQPKPRCVPLPEDLVEAKFVAKPVPASTFADPKQLKDRLELDQKKVQSAHLACVCVSVCPWRARTCMHMSAQSVPPPRPPGHLRPAPHPPALALRIDSRLCNLSSAGRQPCGDEGQVC